VVAVPLSFPVSASDVAEEAVAVFERTVPAANDGSIATSRVKTPLLLTPSDDVEHDTVPLAPTAGVVQDQPPDEDSDTNVVPAGRVSERLTLDASLGPALVAVIV
jgi:hypothetical protein